MDYTAVTPYSKQAFSCSNPTIKTLDKGVKHIQGQS